MESLIVHSVHLSGPLGYVIIFFAMIFEGDIFLFSAAFLSNQGVFNPVCLFVAILSGVLVGDFCWYLSGRHLIKKFPRLAAWVERLARPIDGHLVNRQFRTLFISKFVYNMHHPILVRAGMIGMDAKKFFNNDFFASIIWISIIGGLGYFSSVSISLFGHFLRYAEIGLLIWLAVFLIGSHYLTRKVREKI